MEVAAAEPMNILLLGTDERPDEYGPSHRHDDPPLRQSGDRAMGMVSLLRDLWVPILGWALRPRSHSLSTGRVAGLSWRRRSWPRIRSAALWAGWWITSCANF